LCFSSRSRHTRFSRDWSSDVCSSDLGRENHTRLLWVFEGFTSYYDDLMLLRSGVIDEADYLRMLAKTISGVRRAGGRFKQSVAEIGRASCRDRGQYAEGAAACA